MSLHEKDALQYHAQGRQGKIEVISTKPFATQLDLSLAYTPGVAEPCRVIAEQPDTVYDYTCKGNLVAVVTDGSHVLGGENIGPLASKAVLEGKSILFKRFADIDVFDIELATQDPDRLVRTIRYMEPTFGGINLEDIQAPQCFQIEEQLAQSLQIPVFYDNLDGVAIMAGAALCNALGILGKNIDTVRVVVAGTSAVAVACSRLLVSLGVQRPLICDANGMIAKQRVEGHHPYLARLLVNSIPLSLVDAVRGADVLLGFGREGMLCLELLHLMANNPVVFLLEQPEEARPLMQTVRRDALLATSFSSLPNEIHNLLGFPYVLRGALDVRATKINDAMKLAAVHALAELAKEEVPGDVYLAYGKRRMSFGRDYLLPKPFDARLLYEVAPAVARAAMETGVARKSIADFEAYRQRLDQMLHPTRSVVQRFMAQSRVGKKKRIVFPEGDQEGILRACRTIIDEGIAYPILLGNPPDILATMETLGLEFPADRYHVVNPWEGSNIPEHYINMYTQLRQRKGITQDGARQQLQHRINYALIMLKVGEADGMICGVRRMYEETIKPTLQLVGLRPGVQRACGMYMIFDRHGEVRFFADTTIHINPNAEELAQIAVSASDMVELLGIKPRVAMLSFSNFGTARNTESLKVQKATALAKAMRPRLMIDGEMRVDVAIDPSQYAEDFPFCELKESANVYIFPSLNAGNLGYQMMQHLAGMEVVGPFLIGLAEPVNTLPRNCDPNTIVSVAAITAVMAQRIHPDR